MNRSIPTSAGGFGPGPQSLPLLGGLAGLSASLLDLAAARWVLPGRLPELSPALVAYALSVGAVSGTALGTLASLVSLLARTVVRATARPWTGILTWSLLLGGALIPWHRRLLEGPWVSQQSWVGAARAAVWVASPLSVWVPAAVLVWIWRRGRWWRRSGALAAILAAAACTRLDGTAFPSYETLHHELALRGFACLLASVALLAGSWRSGRVFPPLAGALALFVLAGGAGTWARSDTSIHRIRATIASTPLPSTSKAMPSAERWILASVSSLPDIDSPRPALGISGWTPPDVSADLDRLSPDRRQFNVVWIAIDALRADRVHALGYPRAQTPHIDALAAGGVLFARAYTPAPASMFAYSGALSGMHARASLGYSVEYRAGYPVPDDFSLASQLKRHGFLTAALCAFNTTTLRDNPGFPSFRNGFDRWNENRPADELAGEEVTDLGIRLVDDLRGKGVPFFAWIHYMDPHAPYRFHDDFDFGTRPQDAYDSEIAYCDRELGRLLRHIEKSGIRDETIIVLFGDHGESFGEHNIRHHGGSLHEHQTHVPLVVSVPGLPHRRVDAAVSLADLAPTTLGLLARTDGYRRLGRDLSPLIVGRDAEWLEYAYSERPTSPDRWPGSLERMIVRGTRKLLWNPGAGTWQVFDLSQDPRESTNVFDPTDAEHQKLRDLMAAVDAGIDGYWGAKPAPVQSAAATSPAGKLDLLLSRLEEAGGKAPSAADLQELLKALRGADACFRTEILATFEPDQLARIRDRVLLAASSLEPDSPAATTAVQLLGLWSDDPVVPAIQRLAAGRRPDTRLHAALALAMRGDGSHRASLESARHNRDGYLRLRVHAALACLEDAEAIAAVRAALDSDSAALLAIALRGLASAGETGACERYLLQLQKCWADPMVDRAMAVVGAAGRTPYHRLVLNAVAASSDAAARSAALRALDPSEGDGDAYRDRAESMGGVVQAALGWDWSLAIKYLTGRGGSASPGIPEAAWLARAAWQSGDRPLFERSAAEALQCADIPTSTAEALRRAAASLASGNGMPGTGRIEATVAPDVFGQKLARNDLIRIALNVRNASSNYLWGGPWSSNLRLSWRFLDAKEKPIQPRYVCETYLPREGLTPLESTEISTLARIPDTQGAFVPVLIAGVTPNYDPRTAQVLWKGPTVNVE